MLARPSMPLRISTGWPQRERRHAPMVIMAGPATGTGSARSDPPASHRPSPSIRPG
jgi:hypothetical protein